MNKKITRLVSIGILGAVAVTAGAKLWLDKRQEAEEARLLAESNARQKAELAARIVGPVRLAEDYHEPHTESTARRKQLLESIRASNAQIIVFPPSAPEFRASVDLTARMSIARQLARAIESQTGVPVPDPALVFEAYDAPRRMSPSSATAWMAESHAASVVTGEVWHDAHGKMNVRLVKMRTKGFVSDENPTFERLGIPIGEESPPEMAFKALAPEALTALGFKPVSAAPVQEEAPAALPLPATAEGAGSAQQSATEGLWLQQLIGVLHHSLDEVDPRPRQRVFERTLAGMDSLAEQSGDYAVLLARAQIYLNRPLAARKTLEAAPKTPEATALLAWLNGDLPALKAAVPQITRQIPRIIAECELVRMRAAYRELPEDAARDEAKRLAALGNESWAPLLALFVAHQSTWTTPPPSRLKPLLDQAFPVEGYSAEDIARAKAALGASGDDEQTTMELVMSPLIHSDKWRSANAAAVCCGQGSARFARYDRIQYLDLLDALGEGELVLHLEHLLNVQGRPEAALQHAEQFDRARFHGMNPQIMSVRMQALGELDRGGDSRMHHERLELARRVLSWDSSQSLATAQALSIDGQFSARTSRVPARMKDALPGVDTSVFDFPRDPAWSTKVSYTLVDAALGHEFRRDGCRLTVADFEVCAAYLEKVRSELGEERYRAEVAELVAPRFSGSAARVVMLAEIREKSGDTAGAEKLLQKSVDAGMRQTYVFEHLGNLQMSAGRYQDALRTYLACPLLKAAPGNTVEASNYLESGAFGLLKRGALPQARELFAILAGYRDGSYANLAGAAQFALIDGQYVVARDILQEQYQRYHGEGGVKNLISLLFMLGETERAWSALRDVKVRGDPYETAAVGLRMASADNARLAAWGAQRADQTHSYWQSAWVWYEVLSIDRAAADLRQIYELDAKAQALMQSTLPGQQHYDRDNPQAKAVEALPHPMYIDGYAAFKERNYQKAVELLRPAYLPAGNDAATAHSPVGPQLMPHLALAAASALGKDEALGLLQKLDPPEETAAKPAPAHSLRPDFQLHLIRAVSWALQSDHGKADAELQLARAVVNPGGGALEEGYTFCEMLERLSEMTKRPAYLAMALDYARSYQRFEPWSAWAYAFEARYETDGSSRIRSAAIALKLNPLSHWLSEVDASTLQRAKQWAANNRWPGSQPRAVKSKLDKA